MMSGAYGELRGRLPTVEQRAMWLIFLNRFRQTFPTKWQDATYSALCLNSIVFLPSDLR
ncbi:hypothetical protein EMIT0P258_190071 [Pseudomonas sp. IT-P258]